MSTDRPVAFRSMPADAFPMQIQFHDADTGELVWEATVDGPGALEIPGFAPQKIVVTITYGDGTVDRTYPDGYIRIDQGETS